MINRTSLAELVGSRNRGALEARQGSVAPDLFADLSGFHIYGDLRLNLPLAAATEGRNASTYLNILEHYSLLADVSARQVGAELLEVQGERIHLVLPAPEVNEEALRALFRFSISFTQLVERVIKPLAGEHWSGFALAADHGRAIILATGREGDDSVISLGHAANTPAKRLGRDPLVASGHLAVPLRVAGAVRFLEKEVAAQNRIWIEVNVKEPPQHLSWLADSNLTRHLEEARIVELANEAPISARAVPFANADQFTEGSGATLSSPVTVQGQYLRADLDQFTPQVAKAFQAGEPGIRELIERFTLIMEFPELFARKLNRPTIGLPFAGDCANRILLLKLGEPYEAAQKFLAPTAALAWHDSDSAEEARLKSIRRAMRDARWSIGIAGGDLDEGSSGHMLVADIRTARRAFRITAGWSVRRSLDAQQAENVNADDTVIHIADHKHLDPSYADAFNQLPGSTIFRRATLAGLKKARSEKIKTEAEPAKVQFPYATTAPAIIARPFSY